ncbi:hypothetical protein KM043_011085 [Ampulex compressa]|nr:hypothetical protein KM043_011085 [Ampulex compressa]
MGYLGVLVNWEVSYLIAWSALACCQGGISGPMLARRRRFRFVLPTFRLFWEHRDPVMHSLLALLFIGLTRCQRPGRSAGHGGLEREFLRRLKDLTPYDCEKRLDKCRGSILNETPQTRTIFFTDLLKVS